MFSVHFVGFVLDFGECPTLGCVEDLRRENGLYCVLSLSLMIFVWSLRCLFNGLYLRETGPANRALILLAQNPNSRGTLVANVVIAAADAEDLHNRVS